MQLKIGYNINIMTQIEGFNENNRKERTLKCFIKELIVENFKSYKGRHIIGPFSKGITCIVGPNGSGKSNLMDALSFALGLSSNDMRSTNLKDLIYRSEQEGGPADISQSANILSLPQKDSQSNLSNNAEVSLVFTLHREDNQEIKFSRRILSSGASRYIIDKDVVSQETYVKRLADYNILVKARNFLVFQGDVEDVAQRAPKELTKLFEQISGSDELIEEYDRLSNEQSLNQIVSHNNFNRRKLLEAERRELQKQIEEVNEYERLAEQKANAQLELVLFQLYCNENMGGKYFEERQVIDNEITLMSQNIESARQQIKEDESRLAKDNLEWNKQCNDLERLEQDESLKKNEKIKYEGSIKNNNIELKKIQKQKESMLTFQKKNQKLIEEYEAKIELINNELKDLKVTESSELIDAISSDLQEYIECKKKAEMSSSKLREQSLQIEREIGNKLGLIEILEKENEEIRIQLATSMGLLDSISTKISEQEEKLSHSEETELELNSQIIELEANFNGLTDKIAKLSEQRDIYNERMKNINAKKGEIQREIESRKLIEDMKNYINTGVTMGREEKLVFGRLSDICHSNNKQYNSVIGSALGKYGEYIVVSTWETAKSCICWLKQQRKQPMNFLPLNSIKFDKRGNSSVVEANLRAICNNNKSMRSLAKDNLHTSDERIIPVLEFCLFGVIFTQSLEDAKKIFYTEAPRLGLIPKVMTFDGEKILKNGNISADSSRSQINNKNFAKEYANLFSKIEALNEEIYKLEETESDGQRRLYRLKENLKRLKMDRNATELKIEIYIKNKNEKNTAISLLENQFKEREKEIIQHRSQYESLCTQLENLRNEIHDSDQEHFKKLSKKLNIEDISLLEQEYRKRHEERLNKKKKLSSRLNILIEEYDGIKKKDNSLKEKLKEKESNLVRIENLISEECRKIERLNEEVSEIESKQINIKNKIKSVISFKKGIQRELESKKKSLLELQGLFASKELERNSKNEELEALNEELITLLKNIVFENIQVPLISGEYDDIRRYWEFFELSGKIKSGTHLEDLEPPMIQIDYSALTEKQKNSSKSLKQVESEILRLKRNISDISDRMEFLNPNMKSKGKLKEINAQLEALLEDQRDIRKKSMEIDKSYKLLRKRRVESFMKCFEAVKEAVGDFYSRLTCDESNIGGQAFLDLDDTNLEEPFACGVIFHAMPPSKRFRDIQQLSGGEKTMAALALLFAMQSYRPSPFFVLDEVDAALDPRNVQSIAKFLKKASFQSIVISLKDRLFSQADTLIGVYKNREMQTSSTMTLDLRRYSQPVAITLNGQKENLAYNSALSRSVEYDSHDKGSLKSANFFEHEFNQDIEKAQNSSIK
ncbi:SMC1 structural maintenance of chromosomes 1 [Cryptosporidium sp. chipmunk genotype I]|uniref:SMC1 structural maintenance of chromosomes 1 n=1 Tax=Cryptosporidium sp. chipmunk genotype I TaxID=1280935 RepID=UPI00351AAEA4|nr:SMC1 structural maintenance of chromosomes 1 [Cryptosporidium sp. chipmunk genotype I]